MSYFSRPRLSLGAYLIVARAIGKALRTYDSPALPDTDQASGQAAIAVAVTQLMKAFADDNDRFNPHLFKAEIEKVRKLETQQEGPSYASAKDPL